MPNEAFEFFGRGLGYILVEATWLGTGNQNAFDGIVLERTERACMTERFEHIGSGKPFTQCEDIASVIRGRARLLSFETAKKLCGLRA